MTYFIIIRGPLGVGKSTVAKALAKELNAKYISIDEKLAEHKLDFIPKDADCISKENFIKVNQLILPLVKNSLSEDLPVILDGNFYHQEQIDDLIENLHFQNHLFNLKAPLSTCIKRDNNREKTLGKDATTAVYNLVNRFSIGIDIETDGKNVPEVVREILEKL
jgi:shikimate kinase